MELAAALREATQMLCAAGGVLELDTLRKRLRGGQVTVEELLQCPRRLAVVTRGSGDQAQRVVLAVTEMRLCRATATCNGLCAQLHLCKFLFYGGACKFEKKAGNSCKNGHSLTTVHNQGVLKSYCVDHLSFSEICQLLFQNDPWLLPEICLHYNRGDGLHGSCTFQTQCTKIHVCQHFLQGDCKFEARCKRSHDFSSVETLVKLRKLGMGASLVHKLPAIYRNANDIKRQGSAPDTPLPGAQATSERRNSSGPVSPHSTSEEETDQICLYHIWKSCSFQDKCRRIHFHLPYRWQFLWSDKWIDLHEMERIEEAYSNPGTGRMYCSESADKKLVHWLCFDSMKFGTFPARRLSTASSVTKPPYFLLTTDWLWYWADEAGSWQEYGKQDTQHPVATVSSPDLEKAYLEYCAKGPNTQAATLEFKAGKHKYELDFKAFVQKNLQCSTVRKVRRRPRYVSPQDVTLKQTCKVQLQAPKNIPDYWDPAALPELGFKRVPLSPSSDEYRKVDELFSCTLPSYCIQKIQRVQNLALWEVYQWQKGQMQKRRGGQEVDERQLFHGTSASLVDAICQQNFDWRVCGLHGTSFGKGSYFAVDAAYSHHYAEANTQSHVMFLARVLVGEFVRGRASYVRPPAKEGQSDILYDSCVNSVTHPTIFVIFEKHQVYPEYLVQYTSSAAVAGLPHPLPLATDISRPLRPNLWGLLGR